MIRIYILAALALAGCSPQPIEPGNVSGNDRALTVVDTAIGPPGLELGRPLTDLANSGLEATTICLDARETSPNYFSASLDESRASRQPISTLLDAPTSYFVGRFFNDVFIYDGTCSHAIGLDGQQQALTPDVAATLTPQLPIVQSFGNSRALADYLNSGELLALTGQFDAGGSIVPMTAYLSSGGIEAIHLSFGAYTQAKLEQLLSDLRQRYALEMPSEAQEADFIAGRSSCLGFATSDAQVLLVAQQNVQGAGDIIDVVYQSPAFQSRANILQQCLPAGVGASSAAGRL